jgi:hypothetical protein
LRRAAAGAGDTGHRDREIRRASAGVAPSTISVATCAETAPKASSVASFDAEHVLLGLVRIGHEAAVEHGEDPAISVIAPAIRPPVQDSAVAIIVARVGNVSMISPPGRGNLPGFGVASLPRPLMTCSENHGGRGDRGNSLAAAA